MEFSEDWNKRFQHVTEQFSKLNTIANYQKSSKIELEKTADLEAWRPSAFVIEANPDIENVQIELITSKTDLKQVNAIWREEGKLGLVVLGPTIHRNSKPYLIVVTTRLKFYAIDPDLNHSGNENALLFLKYKLLHDKTLKFYLTNGLHESDCLYNYLPTRYKIDLTQANATCCTGLDISLMKAMKNKPASALEWYPENAVANSRRPTIINKFEKLVETWLDIYKEDIAFHPDQMKHLLDRDNNNNLNLTATNIIKKRCGLVMALAHNLEYYNWLEISIMSSKSFNCLLRGCRRSQRDIYMNLKDGDCASIFFAHYNGVSQDNYDRK